MDRFANTAVLITGLLILYYVWSSWKERQVAHQQGCEPPAKYRHKEPLGFDYVLGTHFDVPSVARHHHRYGKTYQTRFLGSIQMNTCDSQNVQAIMQFNKAWGVGPLRYPGMDIFCGKGIITADGSAWEHSRGLLKNMYRTNNIVHFPTLDTAVNDLFSHLPPEGTTVDLQPLFYNLFLHTATHFLLGFNSLSSDRKSDEVFEDVGSFITDFHNAMFLCGIRIILGRLRFLVPRGKLDKAVNSSHKFLEFYINKAFEEKDDVESLETKSASLLEGLVHRTDDKTEIRNQTLQNLMASTDTISILVSNTVFLLSRHPDVWQQLRDEALSNPVDPPTIASLNAPGLLRNVLFECKLYFFDSLRYCLLATALRLYPVFPLLGRVALVDTTLPVGGGTSGQSRIFIPAGTPAIICFWALHRDETIFGPDVDKFVPRRWERIELDQWEFLPFGKGPRACLGREKALLEASYVMTRLLKKFSRIQSRDDKDYNSEMKLTCRNGNGCNVAVFAW
ncbi:cytochrome P450 alkane hydroxylase protein [Rutstroemia sp. NJR-2017a WRK4]|nr:cytochrome P450 alkane hydroxylase protein [Rutstroemia sp. NJR-2017a WRK4]